MKRQLYSTALVLLGALTFTACAARGTVAPVAAPAAPRFPAYPMPEVPAGFDVTPVVRTRHDNAWNRLQGGDLRGATREWSAVLDEVPAFYPAQAGLGFASLAGEDYEDAFARFQAALAVDDRYLPAWVGQAEALLGLGRDAEAIDAMQRVLALDPSREAVRTRLDLVRFRLTQASIEAGQQATAAGRHDEAVGHFERALAQSPDSTMILSELARAELAAGRLDRAEAHARQAIANEGTHAGWHALLGDVLEARGRYEAAAEAFSRANGLDPSDDWRRRADELRSRAEIAGLPESFRAIASATTITRADVAAYVGIHLRELVDRAPARATTVATDVRTHWASPWILTMTRTGIMPVFSNHTFQPGDVVRRGDLAAVMAELLRLVGRTRPAEVARWQAARPTFADLPSGNLFYDAAAIAAEAGVMEVDSAGRFHPTRPATGAELERAVERVAALAGLSS